MLLAKHVFIDYSGNVVIGNDVQLTNGVIIESHHHPFHSDYTKTRTEVHQSSIEICDGAVIGSRAIILRDATELDYMPVWAPELLSHMMYQITQ